MNRSGLRFRIRQIALLVLVFGTFTTLIWASFVWEKWNRKEPIEASGGRYFFHRTEIPGPLFGKPTNAGATTCSDRHLGRSAAKAVQ
jgi:hypothetical protein